MDRMKESTKSRAIETAQKFIGTSHTVRSLAKEMGISKSTVMHYLKAVSNQNTELSRIVRKHLDYNKSVRHLRGGIATRIKYLKKDGMHDE